MDPSLDMMQRGLEARMKAEAYRRSASRTDNVTVRGVLKGMADAEVDYAEQLDATLKRMENRRLDRG
jgi:hypothetical protein